MRCLLYRSPRLVCVHPRWVEMCPLTPRTKFPSVLLQQCPALSKHPYRYRLVPRLCWLCHLLLWIPSLPLLDLYYPQSPPQAERYEEMVEEESVRGISMKSSTAPTVHSTLIMQLLMDNLTLWTLDMQDSADKPTNAKDGATAEAPAENVVLSLVSACCLNAMLALSIASPCICAPSMGWNVPTHPSNEVPIRPAMPRPVETSLSLSSCPLVFSFGSHPSPCPSPSLTYINHNHH
jgi:hypothetical protein